MKVDESSRNCENSFSIFEVSCCENKVSAVSQAVNLQIILLVCQSVGSFERGEGRKTKTLTDPFHDDGENVVKTEEKNSTTDKRGHKTMAKDSRE